MTARPYMEKLRDASGETVLLSTMNAHCDIRRLAKCVSHHPLRYDVNLDAAITPYCTATGRLLLAHARPEVLESYLSRVRFLTYTRYTVTDPDELRRLLVKVRRDGYALNDQEFVTGSTGIAAPVWNSKGEVIAALNLGTLTSRFLERRELLILMVRETPLNLAHLRNMVAVTEMGGLMRIAKRAALTDGRYPLACRAGHERPAAMRSWGLR